MGLVKTLESGYTYSTLNDLQDPDWVILSGFEVEIFELENLGR